MKFTCSDKWVRSFPFNWGSQFSPESPMVGLQHHGQFRHIFCQKIVSKKNLHDVWPILNIRGSLKDQLIIFATIFKISCPRFRGAVGLWNIVRKNTFFALTRSNFIRFSKFFFSWKLEKILISKNLVKTCLHVFICTGAPTSG